MTHVAEAKNMNEKKNFNNNKYLLKRVFLSKVDIKIFLFNIIKS